MISQRFLELTKRMGEIHEAKNAGYSGQDNPDPWANFRECERFGVPAFAGCLVRMSDKWTRVLNLIRNPANDKVGEAITDTLLDLANYCLIAVCLWEEKHKENSL